MARPVVHSTVHNIGVRGEFTQAILHVPDSITYEKVGQDERSEQWRILSGGVHLANIELFWVGDNRQFYQELSVYDNDGMRISGWSYGPVFGRMDHITGAYYLFDEPRDIPSHDRLMADH